MFNNPLEITLTNSYHEKGCDAGKKISVIKRHIAVDTQGLAHAIHITTANITDRGGSLEMFALHKDILSDVENVLVGCSAYEKIKTTTEPTEPTEGVGMNYSANLNV